MYLRSYGRGLRPHPFVFTPVKKDVRLMVSHAAPRASAGALRIACAPLSRASAWVTCYSTYPWMCLRELYARHPRTQIRIPCISFCTGILCIFLEYMEYMEYTAVYSILYSARGRTKIQKHVFPGVFRVFVF